VLQCSTAWEPVRKWALWKFLGCANHVRVIAGILPDKLEVDVKREIARIERVIIDRVIEHEPAQPVVDATSTQHDRHAENS
jgi:hypothetical protein